MKQSITTDENGDVAITWEAESDEEGVALKEALLDFLNDSALQADEPDDLDELEQAERAALLGSCLDEAAAAGMADE